MLPGGENLLSELTTGVVVPFQPDDEKQAAYTADVTYATNNELGFDYLRDNLAFSTDGKSQRMLNFAIVDEVDSILIDEARTPLIISAAVLRTWSRLGPMILSGMRPVRSGDHARRVGVPPDVRFERGGFIVIGDAVVIVIFITI